MSAEQLERQYSPSSAVGGNYQPYIKDYGSLSNQARAACVNIQTLSYGDKTSNTIDIALPERRDCPLIVFIHGGYWQEGSKLDSFFGADTFVKQGIAYAAIDYTLAPKAGLSEIVAECRQAIKALYSHADKLGIDSSRIILAGSSAGGHLCAMCYTAGTSEENFKPEYPAAGVVLLSGVFELEPLVTTSVNRAVRMSVDEALANSPQFLDTSFFPDAIITWGEVETLEFKRQSRAFADRLTGSNCSVQLFESPSRNHFDIVHDLYNPTTMLGKSVFELISTKS